MTAIMKDDTQLFKKFQDNEGFKRWMTDTVYELAPSKWVVCKLCRAQRPQPLITAASRVLRC